ncbi:flavin-binding monooxygenase-like family protein [Flagelloscypha sp. PMI_526]|nr:flavin-binding monooxygenase-like family protein [Flagelloscypha sp. PMI_526]
MADTSDQVKIQSKYAIEREKRIRPESSAQYAELRSTSEHAYLAADPWVDHDALNAQEPKIKDGSTIKFFVIGAGFGGLLFAIKLIKAGFKAEDIRLADVAGGFGGTWYWNSYIYLPLLEDSNFMPIHKYSYGEEIRTYVNALVDKWNLTDKAAFRTENPRSFSFCSQFIYGAPGVLNIPHVPKLPGLSTFSGPLFHTARWNYEATGGAPGAAPELHSLKDKSVAIIGTGASSIQVLPQVARWTKQVLVFQRTPASVDLRNQKETDPILWKKISSTPGWQLERMRNFNSYLSNAPDGQNLVDDGWTWAPAYSAIVGGPRDLVPFENIPQDIAAFQAMDLPHATRVRARVSEIVKNKTTAKALEAWYPVWCKRPAFHDDYLPTFNQPNVTLVDTDGKGIEQITDKTIVAAGVVYPVDVLILSTGFRSPANGTGSPAYRANITVTGRGGKSMDEKWTENLATLHGVVSRDFPNYFFPGHLQIGTSGNHVFILDQCSTHAVHIISEAAKLAASPEFSVEPTAEAEEAYSALIKSGVANFAAITVCTPSWLDDEGAATKPRPMEEQMKRAAASLYPFGGNMYADLLESWRNKGGLEGIEIVSVE